jgi:hypothetical protein
MQLEEFNSLSISELCQRVIALGPEIAAERAALRQWARTYQMRPDSPSAHIETRKITGQASSNPVPAPHQSGEQGQ